MDLQLTRSRIRPWHPDDLESLVENANDARIAQNLRDVFPHPYTWNDGKAWLSYACSSGQGDSFAIEIDGAAVGAVGRHPKADVHRLTCGVGYWIGADHWGRGVMTEVVSAYTDILFRDHPYERLEAEVYSWNPASMRVVEKCGYALESIQRRAVIKNGQMLDLHLFVRFR